MNDPKTKKSSKNDDQLGKIGSPKGDEDKAQTPRAQRISDLLKDHKKQESLEKNPAYLDAVIRKQLGDLVRMQIEDNNWEELEEVLKEHQSFISDIIRLIHEKKRS